MTWKLSAPRAKGLVCALSCCALLASCGMQEATVSSSGAEVDPGSSSRRGAFSPGPGQDSGGGWSPGPSGGGGGDAGAGQDTGPGGDAGTPPACTPGVEACFNGLDDDCDSLIDSADPDCACTPSAEDCGNGLDDDCDGWVDDADPDCACAPSAEHCSNGVDDDCDGWVDEADPDCLCSPEFEECGNGVDDDCDGLIDGDDPDCACVPSAENCGNGVDDDCDDLVDGDDPDCACVPSAESCGNGVDDDCDGLVDCNDPSCADACMVSCEATEGNNCNGDMGYGDNCAASDNTGGCSPDRFWAWCNRRNTEYGCNDGSDADCIWYEYLRTWVDNRCDGGIQLLDLDGNGYDEFVCTHSDGKTYECTTPLVISFQPQQRVRYRGDDGRAAFDLAPAGAAAITRTDWPSAATPWLALDRDGDGAIRSGRELFGSATPRGQGSARHGFAALADLDHNGDRRIDQRDPAFAQLLVWADGDGDRRSRPAELFSLVELGLESLSLEYAPEPRCDARGNCERERAPMRWRDADGRLRQGAVIDVYLRVQDGPEPAPARVCL